MSVLIRGPQPITQLRAMLELALAAMLWGLGFISTVWVLREAGPLSITGWRFVLAGAVGVFLAKKFFFTRSAREFMRVAWLPGVFIATTLLLQTWGLNYTTATKSAFLTCLYVLFVPMLEPFFGGRKPTLILFLCSIAALFGVALMCGVFSNQELDAKSRLNFGDLLTIGCAVAASAHIIFIGTVHKRLGAEMSGFNFNTAQSLGAGIPTLLVALAIEPGTLRMPLHLIEQSTKGFALPAIGFLSLTILSTLIGFALQVRAQKVLSPSTASIISLLESPFAALFAFIFLNETMGPLQILGGAVILTSVAYSSFATMRKTATA